MLAFINDFSQRVVLHGGLAEQPGVFQPFVKPASALNKASLFLGLLYHNNDHGLHLVLVLVFEYFELLWLSCPTVPQGKQRPGGQVGT